WRPPLHVAPPPPRRLQDPRAVDRTVLADHAAAARRQGPVRRPALRRNGSVGARGVWRRAHPAGTAHREVGRCNRPREDLRIHREGRRVLHGWPPGVVQRVDSRAAVALPRRRADLDEEEARRGSDRGGAGWAGVGGSIMNLRPSFTDTKTTLRADFDAIRISLASPEKIEQ